mmetsp:Transcript_3939/g.10091  ORF Transcript_3939/g.10091 Transcript_3939/m.10091 type:complete len:209 (+) Transcript_3939:107-733(+)
MDSGISSETGYTEILLCRHGETDWNLEGKFQGWHDVPLNDMGRAQAEHISKAVAKRVDAVWTSPLVRARDTGAVVAADAGVELRTDERLKERNLGVLEGRTADEVQNTHPAVWAAWTAAEPLPSEANAEADAAVIARFEAVFQEIAMLHPSQRVVVVAHGGAFRCLLKASAGNASITTIFVSRDGGWHVTKLGDSSHLPQEGLKVSGM